MPRAWSASAGVAGLGGVGLAALGLTSPVLASAGQRAAAASAGSWLFFAGLLLAFAALAMSRGSRGAVWWLRGVVLVVALVAPSVCSSHSTLGALWGALLAWTVASAWAEWVWTRAIRAAGNRDMQNLSVPSN